MKDSTEKVRVDKFLWGIRLYKTRTLASEACESGRIKKNDQSLKPASLVKAGDELRIRIDHHVKTIRILKTIEKRVGAPIAAECYEDLTPVEELPATKKTLKLQPVFYRDRGTGRPTKRERRDMDEFREQFE